MVACRQDAGRRQADKQICSLIFKSVHLIVYTYHTAATEPGHIEIGEGERREGKRGWFSVPLSLRRGERSALRTNGPLNDTTQPAVDFAGALCANYEISAIFGIWYFLAQITWKHWSLVFMQT